MTFFCLAEKIGFDFSPSQGKVKKETTPVISVSLW
jgi:hypothetical protein